MSTRRSGLKVCPSPSWPVVAVLCVLGPWGARAAEVRTGETVVVGAQEVIDDDLYAFGQVVEIRGTVRGDVVAFGRTVDVTGAVEGDVLAAAGETRVSGPVRGSVRAAGGNLALSGPVGRDVLLASGQLRLLPEAQVRGDAYLAGGEVEVRGPVGGEVRAAAGQLVLGAPVAGDVRAEVEELRLTPEASVGGALRYRGEQPAQLAPGAQVAGQVERWPREREGRGPVLALVGWVRALVGLFALGLLLVLASPSLARRAPATLRQAPWRSLGWGVLALVAVPVAAVLVFALGALLGGWWIGVFALGLYALALALCFPVVGLFLGRWVLERFGKAGAPVLLALLLGLALLTLAGLVPVLGALVVLATMLFGLGALLQAALGQRRPASEVPA